MLLVGFCPKKWRCLPNKHDLESWKRCTTPGYPCRVLRSVKMWQTHIESATSTASHQIASIRGSQVNFTPWFVNFLERGTRGPRRLVGFHWKIWISGFGQSDSQTLFCWNKDCFSLFSDLFHFVSFETGVGVFFSPVHPGAKSAETADLRIKALKAVPRFLERIYLPKMSLNPWFLFPLITHFPLKWPGCRDTSAKEPRRPRWPPPCRSSLPRPHWSSYMGFMEIHGG